MKDCPVCNSINPVLWGTKNGYSLYKCLSCTHLFADLENKISNALDSLAEDDFRSAITNNMMQNDDDYYRHLLGGEEKGLHTSVTFAEISELIKAINFEKTKTWLDVGCGSGHIVDNMSKRGWNVIGIEPGEWGQIAARERKLNIIKGFLTKETFNEKFDVISATDVLEHQSNPTEFINLIKYHLKPNGFVILSIPFADSFFAKLQKSKWSMIAPPTHCQFFNTKSINLFASKTGFSIVKRAQYNSTKFRFFSRIIFFDKIINKIFQVFNWGDQAVFVLKPLPQHK